MDTKDAGTIVVIQDAARMLARAARVLRTINVHTPEHLASAALREAAVLINAAQARL